MARRMRLPSALRSPVPLRAAVRSPLVQAVKSAVATILAWVVAGSLVHGQLPVFAAIAALLVVQPSVNQSLGRAVERSLGVIVGVVLAYLIGLAFGDDYWIVLLAIVVAILVGWLLRLTPTTSVQVPISAMLVLSVGATNQDYAVDRIVDTVIGAAIGVIVNILLVPPVAIAPVRQKLDALLGELADRLDAIAAALRSPRTPAQLDELLVLARLLRPMLDGVDAALAAASESLSLNPRRARYDAELAELRGLRDRASVLNTRTIGMTRTLHDRYQAALAQEPSVTAIAEETSRAAHDLRLLRSGARSDPPWQAVATAAIPVLTAPLTIATPDPTHWVLIGSLLEDLRRIHEEIAGDAA